MRGIQLQPPFFLLLVLLLLSQAAATDLFFTKDAYFKEEGFISFSFDYQQFIKRSKDGGVEDWVFHYPFRVDYAITRAVALSLWIPMFSYIQYDESPPDRDVTSLSTTRTPFALGNLGFELRLGFDDLEYEFKSAYYFNYTLDTGPPGLEPYSPTTQQAAIGAIASKKIFKKSALNLNAEYVYELRLDEEAGDKQTFTNLFSFNNFNQGRDEQTEEGDQLRSRNISLFGLEKIFQNFFWNTSLTDPWKEKRNDHLMLSASIDVSLGATYYIRDRRIELGLKPYLELALFLPFSEESIMPRHFVLAPGVYMKFANRLRFLFSVVFAFGNDSLHYNQATMMSLRLVF